MNPQLLRGGRSITVMPMDRIDNMDGLERLHRQTAGARRSLVHIFFAKFRGRCVDSIRPLPQRMKACSMMFSNSRTFPE